MQKKLLISIVLVLARREMNGTCQLFLNLRDEISNSHTDSFKQRIGKKFRKNRKIRKWLNFKNYQTQRNHVYKSLSGTPDE